MVADMNDRLWSPPAPLRVELTHSQTLSRVFSAPRNRTFVNRGPA